MLVKHENQSLFCSKLKDSLLLLDDVDKDNAFRSCSWYKSSVIQMRMASVISSALHGLPNDTKALISEEPYALLQNNPVEGMHLFIYLTVGHG